MNPRMMFARHLREKMKAHHWTVKTLAAESGTWPSQVTRWRRGAALPNRQVVSRFAVLLDWPSIVKEYDRLLTANCDYCGGVFQRKHHAPTYQRFCSDRCRNFWHIDVGKKRRRSETPQTVRSLAGRLSGKETRISDLLDENNAILAGIKAFCDACEWDGTCKTPACELREWSPLPLAVKKVV